MNSRHAQIVGKAICGANAATALRLVRYGPKDALRRAVKAYSIINPLQGRSASSSRKLLQSIPEVPLDDIVPSPEPILVDGRYAEAEGCMPLHELVRLLAIAKHANPAGVLEIGTYFGSTTLNLALNLPGSKIHTADLPPEYAGEAGELPKDDFHLIRSRRVGAAFLGTPQATMITQHFGDTAEYDFGKITDPLDFFFIDGSHTYAYARSDTLRCAEVARSVSTFIWHDCDESHPGVVRWISEMRSAGLPVVRITGTSAAYMKTSVEVLETFRAVGQLRHAA